MRAAALVAHFCRQPSNVLFFSTACLRLRSADSGGRDFWNRDFLEMRASDDREGQNNSCDCEKWSDSHTSRNWDLARFQVNYLFLLMKIWWTKRIALPDVANIIIYYYQPNKFDFWLFYYDSFAKSKETMFAFRQSLIEWEYNAVLIFSTFLFKNCYIYKFFYEMTNLITPTTSSTLLKKRQKLGWGRVRPKNLYVERRPF